MIIIFLYWANRSFIWNTVKIFKWLITWNQSPWIFSCYIIKDQFAISSVFIIFVVLHFLWKKRISLRICNKKRNINTGNISLLNKFNTDICIYNFIYYRFFFSIWFSFTYCIHYIAVTEIFMINKKSNIINFTKEYISSNK